MATLDEQLLQSLMLREPEPGSRGQFDPLMREAIRLQNEAARRAVAQPDTSGYAKAGFDREMRGMNDIAAGMAMATAPPEFHQMAGATYKSGLAAQEPMEMGEGLYMPGTGYVQDPFKKQDRLTRALSGQAAFGTHAATAYGTQEHQRATEEQARLALQAQIEHQRRTERTAGGHLALARQQAELGKIMQIDDPTTGLKQTVRISMGPGGVPTMVPLALPGAMAAQPGATPPMPNLKSDEAKALGYAMRATEASKVLEKIGGGYSAESVGFKGGLESVRGVGGALGAGYNYFMGAPEQQVEQAQRDFINAILRPESGAVINPTEFTNARQQYFPQPGDSPVLLEQKKRNRELKIQGLLIEAGPVGTRYHAALQANAQAGAGAPGGAGGGPTPGPAPAAQPGASARPGDPYKRQVLGGPP